jgi:hypothetical protein
MDWISLCICIQILCWYGYIIKWNETRPYLSEINDPIFRWIGKPIDATYPVAICLYVSLAIFIYNYMYWTTQMSTVLWTFILIMISRSLVLYLHPFQGHHTMIPLRDLLVETFLNETKPLRSDCSYSGHCSTIMALGLNCPPKYTMYFFILTLLSAYFLVKSRVHYSADCLLAIIFSHYCYIWSNTVHTLITQNVNHYLLYLFVGTSTFLYIRYNNKTFSK